MNNEEEIIKQIKVLIQYAKDHEHTEITATEVNALQLFLELYNNKKEEIYAIARANYDVGMLEERSQWYKKINEKIKEYDKMINATYSDMTVCGDFRRDACIEIKNNLQELIGKEE